MAKKLTTLERTQIADELRAGKSQGETARKFCRSVGTVNAIAKAEEIRSPFEDSNINEKRDARRAYAREGRLDLSDFLFSRIRELGEREELKPGELQHLTVAFGVLTDKRMLESAKATARIAVMGEDNRTAFNKLRKFLELGEFPKEGGLEPNGNHNNDLP